jgi:hypothetical protein
MNEPIQIPVRRCTHATTDPTSGTSYNCDQPGIWIPVLLLYPSVLHGPSKPMLVSIDAALCTTHKNDATVKDFATEHIYTLAEKACANAGTPWPERALTRLKFLPYAESQLGKIKNQELAAKN